MNSSALANNNIEPGLLEQQNKERKFVAQQARDNIRRRPDGHAISRQLRVEYPAVVDIEPQLMQLEHQRKKRELVEQEERDVTGGGRDSQAMSDFQPFRREEQSSVKSPGLMDYQDQLMQLEQQNKRRRLMAPQERGVIGGMGDSQEMSGLQPVEPENQPSVKDQALADYQTELKRLEQIKKREIIAQRWLKAGGGRRKSRKTSSLEPVMPGNTSLPSAASSPPGAPELKQLELHDGHFTTSYDRKP